MAKASMHGNVDLEHIHRAIEIVKLIKEKEQIGKEMSNDVSKKSA